MLREHGPKYLGADFRNVREPDRREVCVADDGCVIDSDVRALLRGDRPQCSHRWCGHCDVVVSVSALHQQREVRQVVQHAPQSLGAEQHRAQAQRARRHDEQLVL